MAEYIDIDAQVVVTDTRGCEHETTVRHIFEMNKGVYTAADVVERKTGTWIPVKEETGVEAFGFKEKTVVAFRCSTCGKEVDVSEGNFSFCPNCGAQMEGREWL